MPVIDIYAPAGIFPDVHRDAAAAVMAIEQAPDIPMFRQNVGAPLGGEISRMEAIWRAAPDWRRGPRLG
jgi:hypothetical protein